MKKKITITIIRSIIIILLLIIFFFVMRNLIMSDIVLDSDQYTNYDNDFEYKPSNTRILYNNVGMYPWDKHTISSSIPYDIKIKKELENVYYYEYDNETYNNKLKELFNSKREDVIIATDGTKWSKWINPKKETNEDVKKNLVKYYEVIFNTFYKILNDSITMDLPGDDEKKKIQIVHDLMKRYKRNEDDKDYLLFEIEMILYREGKLQGKHIKIIAVSNSRDVHIIDVRIVGVVSEDNIVIYPYVGNDTTNNNSFDIFVPEDRIHTYSNKIQNHELNVFDKNVNMQIDDIIYKRIINDYNYEDEDISNNNFIPEKKDVLKKST